MPQTSFQDTAILLHDCDDVAVLKRPVKPSDVLIRNGGTLVITQQIPAGHKIAVKPIEAGAPVKKYGQVIGFATAAIQSGTHVHTHNLAIKEFSRDYNFCADAKPVVYYPQERMRSFQGYARPGGQVGTRN